MNHQIIGFTLGLLLAILGGAELIPAIVEWAYGSSNAGSFFISAMFSIFFGSALVLSNKSFNREMTLRQTFIITVMSWVAISFFAAIPLWMSNINVSFTDAVFETVSAITTTGSTVLSGLDTMSPGILLWRSIIEWIGGIGLIAFAIIFLPFLRVGGMQLFQTESSDKSEKIMPKSADIMRSLLVVYSLLTILCGFCYYFAGMSGFDAVNHALTTIPTAGYSTHDASFGYFADNPLILWICTFFMFICGLPFILFIQWGYQGKFNFTKDEQAKVYSMITFAAIIVLTVWLWMNGKYSFFDSITHSAFNLVSIITTTGFASTDYSAWGHFPVMLFFLLTYIGASAGSTSGGMKTMRIIVVSKALDYQLKTMIYPHSLFPMRYQGKVIDQSLVITVLGFCALYVMSNVFLTLALTLTGLDFITAITGAATALANVGPGLGPIIGPSGNFAPLPDTAKWLLCFGMILGRLEILTVMVLFSSYYWHK